MRGLLGDIRGRALWVVLGCLVCQMGLGFGYSFGALAPEILEEFGWSRAAFSSARAPQLWVISLASPLVGWATLRFGGRIVLLGSTALLGAGFVALSGLQTLLQLTGLIAVIGLALTGVGDIAAGGIVAQWVTRARGLALGLVYTGSNLGGGLVTMLAGAVLGFAGWREAFVAIGLLGLVVMFPFAYYTLRDREGAASAGDAPDAGDAGRGGDPGDLDVRAAMRTPSFWILAVTLFAFWFYFLAMLDHLVLFLTDVGVSDARDHFRNAILLGMVSKIAFGWIADRLGAKRALLFDFGLLALSSGLLLALPEPTLLWVFVVTYGFSAAARDVVTPLIVAHCFGVRYLAQIYGVLMLTLLPGGTLGPIFAGTVHDAFGSYDWAFRTFAAFNALSFGLLLLVGDERPLFDDRDLSGRAPSAGG